MGPQVSLQQPRAGESFPTELALVVQVVGEDVHAQRRHADIHLVTDVALLSIPRVQAAVSLSVPGEVAAGGVMFAAVRTAVLGPLTFLPALLAPPVRNGQSGLSLGEVEGGEGGEGGGVPRVWDGRGERHVVAYLAAGVAGGGGGGGGAGGGRTDVDEGGELLLRLRGGRGGGGAVRAGAHLGGTRAGQGREGARQLQQVVGSLRLLLGPMVSPASIWGGNI